VQYIYIYIYIYTVYLIFSGLQVLSLPVAPRRGDLSVPSSPPRPVRRLLSGLVCLRLLQPEPEQGGAGAARPGRRRPHPLRQGLRRRFWLPDRGPPQGG